MNRTARSRGFTIIEILMATAVLMLGMVGILALFPYAIDAGKKVMERSTAVTIAKSVAEQIRAGIRNEKRTIETGTEPFIYFIFRHDGVKDPIPKDKARERPSGDYFILLPQFRRSGQGFPGPNDEARRRRAVENSKEFVYPEDDVPMNGGGNPFRADNDGDDHPDGNQILVKKVYQIGNLLPSEDDAVSGLIDEEHLLSDQMYDTFKQYSFAFSIRASMWDTNLSYQTGRYLPGNSLYHVRVMVFRQFNYNEEKVQKDGVIPEPVYEMDFEVSL